MLPTTPPSSSSDGSRGRAVRPSPPHVQQFVGVVRAGPASAGLGEDYTDCRYYVDRAIITATGDAAVAASVDHLSGLAETITATNLAELADGSHLLPPGTLVQVFALYNRATDSTMFVFDQSTSDGVVVQITSNGAGGEYGGKILAGNASAGTDGLTMPAGMSAPPSENAILLNADESGQTGNRLATGSYSTGIVCGRTEDSPPKFVVVIRGGVGSTASPKTLGSSGNSSESADATTWSKAGDATALNLTMVSRVVYNPSGDKTIYAFVRTLTFDARGELSSVSGETRVSVATTEACS